MKTLNGFLVMAMVIGFGVSLGHSNPGHDMTPYTGSKEFESIKKLAGRWEGTGGDMHGDETVVVDYKVTSGGSAVIETLFPGKPEEMTSVYSEDKGRITMTHYCMMKNHPKMELKKSSGADLSFSLAKDGNVDPKSPHMHALVISMPTNDQLIQKWTMFEGGKEKQTSTFNFNRKG